MNRNMLRTNFKLLLQKIKTKSEGQVWSSKQFKNVKKFCSTLKFSVLKHERNFFNGYSF